MPHNAAKPAMAAAKCGLLESRSSGWLNGSPDSSPPRAVQQLNAARARLNAGLDLIDRALDLREHLCWGVFDIEDARAAVAAFKRDAEAFRWRRP
jgi:hypothetical protein